MARSSLLALAILVTACAAPDSVAPARERLRLDEWGAAREPIPSDSVLLEQLVDAVELRQRKELTRILDAKEPGEQIEHAMITQYGLDTGAFGVDALFAVGDDLFDFLFRPENGLGNGLDGPAPAMRRVHDGERGGPDELACSSCHSLGGLDGAGTGTQNAFLRGDGDGTLESDLRNPPALLGLGPVQALAEEMSAALAAARASAIETALATRAPVTVDLETHGVRFGTLVVDASGRVDSRGVDGVDQDLVVRPFGWKGHQATIRGIAAESFRIHMGIVSVVDQLRVASGTLDPAIYGDGPPLDVDGDGVSVEIEDGMLTTISAYLAQLEVPVIAPPADEAALERFARGSALFTELGCASCHRPVLELADPILELRPEHPDFADRPPFVVNVAEDGDLPKIERRVVLRELYEVSLFSDLRRHDMGAELASPEYQGNIAPTVFLTRPLWGLAVTAPYLHDGRAPTVEDAILAHGGEAEGAREAYAALGDEEHAALRTYLMSLTREAKVLIP